MDTQTIKKIFSLYDTVVVYEDPRNFPEELNRQCSLVLVPACLIAMFSWIFYIRLDAQLFYHLPIIIWLRIGLPAVAVIILVLHFFTYFKTLNYWLLFCLTGYFELAAAIIVGLVAPHTAYMGGMALLVLILPLLPFRKTHSLILLTITLVVVAGVGIWHKIKFINSKDLYGLLNLLAAVAVSLVAIFVLDNIRRVSFDKNRKIQVNNEKLKESSDEIRDMNDALKKANDLKSKLLEIAAHDLKSPLQVIVGYTDLLQEKFEGNEAAKDKLDNINRSSENMIRLISRLLKSLSIESEKLIVTKRNINFVRLVEAVIRENRSYADRKQQNIYFDSGKECTVQGDETLLKEIIDNLLNNALKFSPAGKSIWVTIENSDDRINCKIRDEGPGFRDSDKEKMFRRFQKLSAKPTEGESSTGLGLAIVKELVELHKGEVSVESEPGAGSTFTVTLQHIKGKTAHTHRGAVNKTN